jgi:hypothetical protein
MRLQQLAVLPSVSQIPAVTLNKPAVATAMQVYTVHSFHLLTT